LSPTDTAVLTSLDRDERILGVMMLAGSMIGIGS